MVMSRKKLLLAAAACIVMAPMPIVTGMRENSPARLADFLGALPLSVWMGLATMFVLVVACWFSIDDGVEAAGGAGPGESRE
jgi:hypothetical protein